MHVRLRGCAARHAVPLLLHRKYSDFYIDRSRGSAGGTATTLRMLRCNVVDRPWSSCVDLAEILYVEALLGLLHFYMQCVQYLQFRLCLFVSVTYLCTYLMRIGFQRCCRLLKSTEIGSRVGPIRWRE